MAREAFAGGVPLLCSGCSGGARGRSAVPSVFTASRSCGALSLRPASVVVEPEFEDLGEDDGVDQVGAVRGAGWRRSGAECHRLPGRLRVPPSPRFSGGVAEGSGGTCCATDMGHGAEAQKDLVVFSLCFWVHL